MTKWNDHRIDAISNGKSLSVVIDLTDTYTISDENPAFEAARTAWREKNFDALIAAVKPIEGLRQVGNRIGGVEVLENEVLYNGVPMQGVLINRILDFARNGYDYEYLVKFLEKLKRNPSATAVEELYLFLESANTPMPITQNGNFLAYKKVRRDYYDIYSCTVRYAIGDTPEMARNEVDDNRNRTCSYGLHFCSIGYLPNFGAYDPSGARIVIVEIDPEFVVAIPKDYANAKGRASKMTVVGELTDDQYRAAQAGIGAWNNKGYVETDYDEDEAGDCPVFDTRSEAREYAREYGGVVRDHRNKAARGWIVSDCTSQRVSPNPGFFSRSQAREYQEQNGGFVADTWKTEYESYATDDENLRWVVINS